MSKERKKRIAMVIAFRSFRDEEYFIPRDFFEKEGMEVITVSDKLGIAVGGNGGDVEVNILLNELDVNQFDAVVFVGGPGAYRYIEDEEAHKIVREIVESGKLLGAICIAPLILAKAGILKDKKATVWSSILDKNPIKIFKEYGVFYEDKDVVEDKNIITANGPEAAEEFAKVLTNYLKKIK